MPKSKSILIRGIQILLLGVLLFLGVVAVMDFNPTPQQVEKTVVYESK